MTGIRWMNPAQMRSRIGTGWQMAPNAEWVSEEHRLLYESGALTIYNPPTAWTDAHGSR